MTATSLFYCDIPTGGTSDKEWHIQIEQKDYGYVVNYQFGRRGGTLQSRTFTPEPVSLEEATTIYNKRVRSQLSDGYIGAEARSSNGHQAPVAPASTAGRTPFECELLEEVDEDQGMKLVRDDNWLMQPKLDGHRIQIHLLADGTVNGYNKKGTSVAIAAEVAKEIRKMTDENTLFFSGEMIGTQYIAFDILIADGRDLTGMMYRARLKELDKYMLPKSKHVASIVTYYSLRQKVAGLAELRARRAEGVAFKLASAVYRAGRVNHKKWKFTKTCTCKVVATGFKGHNSATLAAVRDGKWCEIGRASLIGKDKRIAIGSFVEVEFLYMTEGHRLYQPRIKEFRTDADASDCGWQQFKHAYKEGVVAA